ncbi:MAG: hypothetical protein RL701_2747 [Pseudomonadota bacterium]|jgi:hypothetical protein
MIQSRVLLTLSAVCVLSSCTGNIEDGFAQPLIAQAADETNDWTSDAGTQGAAGAPAKTGEQVAQPTAALANNDAGQAASDVAREPERAPATDKGNATTPSTTATYAADKPKEAASAFSADQLQLAKTLNAGALAGPKPQIQDKLTGAPFLLIKDWDFGTKGTIGNKDELKKEFMFHDHFGTIANGSNYGAVTVAADEESAIGAGGLGLPNDRQPVEDPARPIREFTADSMLAHVRPLSTSQTTVSAWKHDVGNGSITSKWKLEKGGQLSGHDLVWETRVRMPKQVPAYWYALWTAGQKWNKGAEMDVLESFGAPHTPGDSFHADSVGGVNMVEYKSWPNALDEVGVPKNIRALSDWHTFSWVYLKDDTFEIYYDGYRVQHGTINWTFGAVAGAEPVDMSFLFDFSWGHTQVPDVNIELPASAFPLTYEIDYSRVYVR